MKKLYFFALAGGLMAVSSAFAAEPQVKEALITDAPAQKLTLSQEVLQKTPMAKAPMKADAADEGTWVKSSTGIWFEGPLAARFTDVDAGQWDVDIYENEAQPGWIRLNPYTEDTPPAKLLGRANANYLDICIADPAKCYFLDWKAFNSFEYGSYCKENGWPIDANGYGTLEDGVLTFAPGSVAYAGNNGYALLNGEIKIVLDKSQYVDYTVDVFAPFCSGYDDQYFGFTKSDAVTTVKAIALNGTYPMNDNNAAVVKQQGVDITSYAGRYIDFGLDAAKDQYSILYVGLAADGSIKAQGVVYTFVLDDEADDWKELGDATYSEGVLCLLFSDIDTEDLTCKVEENIATPGYFRLVNAYDNHSMEFGTSHDHNHYIYINATDPDHVYVEPSVIGANVPGFGDFACKSWGYSYLNKVEQGEKDAVWGKYADGVITVPQFLIQLSEYNNANWMSMYSADEPSVFSVKLPETSGISNVAVDESNQAPVYYNLQGVRIANPENGLFIEVRGNKVTKAIK